MGYYVTGSPSDCFIPADNVDEAYQRLMNLNSSKYNHLKAGGSWANGKQTSFWYSWMPESFEGFNSLEDILEAIGFDCEVAENGDVYLGCYDSKSGQEELLISEIADLFDHSSLYTWNGEDGETWQWLFTSAGLVVQSGTVVYSGGTNVSRPSGQVGKKRPGEGRK